MDDELDTRIRAALQALTGPARPTTTRDLVGSRIRRPAPRNLVGRTAPALLVAIALLVGGIATALFLDLRRDAASIARPTAAGVSPDRSAAGSVAPQEIELDAAVWMEQKWPASMEGRWGTTDTSAYDREPPIALSQFPVVSGPFVERFGGGPDVTTYLALPGPEALFERAQVIVRGRPLAFSRPYFNSSDGSFWRPELTGAVDGSKAAQDLQQDVLFRVDKVLGTTLPAGFEPGVIEFMVTAGQAVVMVPRDVPYAPGEGDQKLAEGRYLFEERPTADLRIGQEYVLFLKYQRWLGWYGERYATETLGRDRRTTCRKRVDERGPADYPLHMPKEVKTHRRRGRTTISTKNQVTLPVEALTGAGLKVGDRLRADVSGPGRIILVKEDDPLERFAGALTGIYADGYLDDLRREWT